MRTVSIPTDIHKYWKQDLNTEQIISEVQASYQKLLKGDPEVSIVIPAYNEESNILKTLRSICLNTTSKPVEIIVVDNNSTDATAHLVRACGVTCVSETQQGITFARNCGLSHARGRYIINADADTIYPSFWIEELIEPLRQNQKLALTYGSFSFLPTGDTKRITYFLFEHIAELSRTLNKYFREEAVNVYGFNSAFRKEQGIMVDGYNHPPGSKEDGYLALKLRDAGFGRLYHAKKAIAWTTDRRIHIDGGLWIGAFKRFKRVVTGG
jgi:glycosyltransferase involved in cell wall biosynthesis